MKSQCLNSLYIKVKPRGDVYEIIQAEKRDYTASIHMDYSCVHTRDGIHVYYNERLFEYTWYKLLKMMLRSKRGVVTHPIGFGFIIGLVIGLIIAGFLIYIVISGNLEIPFIGGG